MMNKRFYSNNGEMKSLKNCMLHGLYLCFYAIFKNLSFPLSNYLRFVVLRMFSPGIRSTYISDGVMIWFPWRVTIKEKSSLNQGVVIDGYGGVTIGKGVRIAAYSVINTADHNFLDASKFIMDQGYVCDKVVIEDNVWIGSHVCINKGTRIGTGSVIGSGAVVTKDIPPYSVAVGVPCHVIRKRK